MARPQQPGLTENELDVMKVLWKEAPLKVAEILERLQRRLCVFPSVAKAQLYDQ